MSDKKRAYYDSLEKFFLNLYKFNEFMLIVNEFTYKLIILKNIYDFLM